MDKTSFWWTGLCSMCHPGGGPSEFDRRGDLYYDVTSDRFGYEKRGLTAGDMDYSGDYTEINHMTGAYRSAPWDVTGVSEPDCMLCHRADRTIADGKNMNWIWRAASLRAKDQLVDSADDPLPAYASAPTASQGWISNLQMASLPPGMPPMATSFDIDYSVGVANGSLRQGPGGLYVQSTAISGTPKDYACWGCHITPDLKKRGRAWFDPQQDVHYAGFNKLDDADAGNDVAPIDSTACTYCHPADSTGIALNHNIAKGNATLGSVRDDTDYTDFRTCADCHLAGALKDPFAPTPPTSTFHNATHRAKLSCEACHIPFKSTPADLAIDNAVTGATITFSTSAFLSADPLNPADADKSRWYPSFVWKKDRDGQDRIFPVKLLLSLWWGDWDDNGTPGNLADDVIAPISLWRVRQITGGSALPGTADDNGDGKPEVNTDAEMLAYFAALRGNDSYGRQVAARPVLVKGGRVYYEAPGGGAVEHFEYEGTGIDVESSHPFAVNHNVLPATQAFGIAGCGDCHGGSGTPVFDRKVLVDPYDENGNPVFKTVREILGFGP